MMNKTATAMTGIAVAVAAGATAYMVSHRRSAGSRKLRRSATKAIKTLGNVLDSVENMMR